MSCKMNSNREYIHGYCSPCKRFFNSFFLSPLSNCNKLTRQGRRISKRHRHRHHQTTTNPTTKPSATTNTATQHRKISQNQQKLKNQPNPKSTETQKSTQPKINKNPKINLTQNQLKITGKPNPKIVHTHRKTQTNEVGSVATAAIGSSIAAGSSTAVVGWRWEAKGRLWRREGGRKRKEADSIGG